MGIAPLTAHSLLATHYSLLATHYSLLATRYSNCDRRGGESPWCCRHHLSIPRADPQPRPSAFLPSCASHPKAPRPRICCPPARGRQGYPLSYVKNKYTRSTSKGRTRNFYTLSFELEFEHEGDVVYIAYSEPYTHTRLQQLLGRIQVASPSGGEEWVE